MSKSPTSGAASALRHLLSDPRPKTVRNPPLQLSVQDEPPRLSMHMTLAPRWERIEALIDH